MRDFLYNLVLIIPFLFAGCATQLEHYYYQQNPPEVSLFTEKNEARVSGHITASRNTNSKGLQASYSITDKFSLAVNWYTFANSKGSTVNGQSTGSWSGNYYEGALGYYKNLEAYGIFEVYGGMGAGNREHLYADLKEDIVWFVPVYTITPIGSSSLNYSKYFIQPSYGISLINCFDFAVYVRGSYFDYYSVKNNVAKGYKDYTAVNSIKSDHSCWMFEPGVTLRAGYKFIKFQMQMGLTGSTASYNYDSFYFSFGTQLSFSKKYFREKKKNQESSVSDASY